jgi:preprotein translocase SecE subunit
MNKIKYFFNEFLPEVKAEWKKVTTPSQKEVVSTTTVVIITSFLFAGFLWATDQVVIAIYEQVYALAVQVLDKF